MRLQEQIKEYRKKAGLTQEQLANCLGVSTPAVSKWETGASHPDITLLAPLARLLKIDLNTLFSFHESLSREEVGRFCEEVSAVVGAEGLEAGFAAAAEKLQEYPNCDLLRYSLALLLEGNLDFSASAIEGRADYERRLMEWYAQAADSQDAEVREAAIWILASKYLTAGNIEKAETLIELLPDKSAIDKRILQINVLIERGEFKEAATMAERKIFEGISTLQSDFIKLVDLDLLLEDIMAAASVAEAAERMARIFGFWEYNAYVCPLQVAFARKDVEKSLALLTDLLDAALTPIQLPLMFQHLPMKPAGDDFAARVIALLLWQLETDETCAFLRPHPEFQALLAAYRDKGFKSVQ